MWYPPFEVNGAETTSCTSSYDGDNHFGGIIKEAWNSLD
jgi:hypothetical protein